MRNIVLLFLLFCSFTANAQNPYPAGFDMQEAQNAMKQMQAQMQDILKDPNIQKQMQNAVHDLGVVGDMAACMDYGNP